MPSPAFQRVLLFLNPEFGSSVHNVYRLSRLYDRLSERSALVMLAAWRGSTMAVTRAKYRPALYDDERSRARSAHRRRRPLCSPAPRRPHGSGADAALTSHERIEAHALRQIEKMPPCPVLGLDDPGIRIEPDFLGETFFHRWFRHRLRRCRRENALDRPAVVIDRLRRRHVQHGVAVEQRDLDEYRAGLFRAAPAHGAEHALGLAAAQISRHPYAGFQSHGIDDRPARAESS